jgi:hypothetical protein
MRLWISGDVPTYFQAIFSLFRAEKLQKFVSKIVFLRFSIQFRHNIDEIFWNYDLQLWKVLFLAYAVHADPIGHNGIS